MKKYWLRSFIFNILFYGVSALSAIAAVPTLIMPRWGVMFVTRVYLGTTYLVEKYIFGLDYEVRGAEHLPEGSAYIIAAKHQSAYETTKLHKLFGDPAIILKKELLSLPIWGKCLAKTDVIAIDRSTPDSALQSIRDGAQRMMKAGRPIVIFPQGTRVGLDTPAARRPYKIGVVRIQEATGLPIIPMAMNSGYFWPRNSFLKRPGKVIFEFLPPIEAGKEPNDILKTLTDTIEEKSNALVEEAKQTPPKKNWLMRIIVTLAILYTALWFGAAHIMKTQYNAAIDRIDYVDRVSAPIEVSGFPARIHMRVDNEIINTLDSAVSVNEISVRAWPLPFVPALIQTGAIEFSNQAWDAPLIFDAIQGDITPTLNSAIINKASVMRENFKAELSGEVTYEASPYPDAAMHIGFKNPAAFIADLQSANILNANQARMFTAGALSFQNAEQNASAPTVPLRVFESKVYIGPFKIFDLP